MSRKRPPPKRFDLVGECRGEAVEYVAKTSQELRPELERVQQGIRSALRALNIKPVLRHVVSKTTVYQLRAVQRDLPSDATDEDVVRELIRLNTAMDDALFNLNKLEHSRVKPIEDARFCLRFGQTPKKRDIPEKSEATFEEDKETTDDGITEVDG